jgi:hypothetical protein
MKQGCPYRKVGHNRLVNFASDLRGDKPQHYIPIATIIEGIVCPSSIA